MQACLSFRLSSKAKLVLQATFLQKMAHVIKRDRFIELAPKFMSHSRSISQLPTGEYVERKAYLGGAEDLGSDILSAVHARGQSNTESEIVELSLPEKVFHILGTTLLYPRKASLDLGIPGELG